MIGQILGLWSILFWRKPTEDKDIVDVIEGTSLVIVLRRDKEAEAKEQSEFATRKGSDTEGTMPLYETRHYYIDVKRCELDLIIREPNTTYKSHIGESTLLKSWSCRYTKTRRREGMGGGPPGYNKDGEGSAAGPWQCQVINYMVTVFPFSRVGAGDSDRGGGEGTKSTPFGCLITFVSLCFRRGWNTTSLFGRR